MNAELMALEKPYAPESYYSEGFRNVLEDHMEILRKDPNNETLTVSPMIAYKHNFDLVKVFRELNIPPELHWVVMRMNNLQSMRDVPSNLESLVVPEKRKISRLHQSYNAKQKIN